MNNDFRYLPLEENEYEDSLKKHLSVIEMFVESNGYDRKEIVVNHKNVLAVIAKVHQRKKYFQYFHGMDISEFKEVALICFWYMKLKPICVMAETKEAFDKGQFDAINEKLALFYLLHTFRRMLEKHHMPTDKLDSLPKAYLKEILYSFEYRDISKEALTLLVESIAVFLGLSPYQNIG